MKAADPIDFYRHQGRAPVRHAASIGELRPMVFEAQEMHLRSVRDNFQALFADRFATGRAFAVGSFLDTIQRRVDLRNLQPGGAFEPREDFVGFGFGRLFRKIRVRGLPQVAFDLLDLGA